MNSFLVAPGRRVQLKESVANQGGQFPGGKPAAEEQLKKLIRELEDLQYLLFAEHRQKVLVVLQGVDASGKDGVIRRVFGQLDPQGVRVASFKAPTQGELAHDYLWRIHQQVPGYGQLTIFNRSHYEDVLVVRVHNMVPPSVWKKRFAQINDFERMLSEEGTTILKLFLHISKDEQKKRLENRLKDPTKNWKFDPADLRERERWSDYQKAYEDVFNKTSTFCAPWHIIPANHKWFRNVTIASILVGALKGLKMRFPKPKVDLSTIVVK
jgi:PPK2 family polyphosphate:nucleotide phosphotransferase